LIGPSAAGREQEQHEYLYWEILGWTAIRQGNWRAVKPPKTEKWELYDLATDPSESQDLAAANPDTLAKLTALAAVAHEPVREGTFSRTDRHERDRRAKFGKHDEPEDAEPKAKAKKAAAKKAKARP
jgi:arylsulfatase A-like enzyme